MTTGVPNNFSVTVMPPHQFTMTWDQYNALLTEVFALTNDILKVIAFNKWAHNQSYYPISVPMTTTVTA